MNKRLANLLTAELDKRIDGCVECEDGMICDNPYNADDTNNYRQCPHCAQWRAWRDKLCWHEVHAYHAGRTCDCGIKISAFTSGSHPCDNKALVHPTFTIQLTREWLERLGLYKDYIRWHLEIIISIYTMDDGSEMVSADGTAQVMQALQSDTLNLQAVIAFMEGLND